MNENGVTVQSVARALHILDCFVASDAELGISDIAERMALSKSTVYGLVNTLTVLGYLEQSAATKKYRLGLRLFELGNLVGSRMDLRQEARPYCQSLAVSFGQASHLAVRRQYEVVYIDKVNAPNFSISYSYTGKRGQMYCTGVGKAILSFLPLSEWDHYLREKELLPLTPNTITDADALRRELQQTRDRGYAIDNEEVELGLKCVAAPIFDWQGLPVAAISSSGMAVSITGDRIGAIAVEVTKAAAQISKKLGYAP